jgi:phospholipase/carboxylesterase
MAHGNADLVIPATLAKASRDLLLAANYQVEWHEYAMEHAVCAEEIIDISSWLRRIIR